MSESMTPGGEMPAGAPTTTTSTTPATSNPLVSPTPAQVRAAVQQAGATPATAPTPPSTPTSPTAQRAVTPGQEPGAVGDGDGDGEGAAGEPFDRDRAMATIRKLREEAKAAVKQLKEVDALKARLQEYDDAKLTEQERTAKRLQQLEAELEFERTERRERTNRYEVQLRAAALGIVDPDAAVKLLDWGRLEYDADGAPKDVDAALKELLTQRPYLGGQSMAAQQQVPAGPQTAATNGATRTPAGQPRVYTAADLANREFYLAHRDDIIRAYREGRVRN